MEKLIIVNALSKSTSRKKGPVVEHSFRSTPKLHSSGRRTGRKMYFEEPVLGKIVKEVAFGDSLYVEIEILLGYGCIYDKTPANSSRSNEAFYILKDDLKLVHLFTQGDEVNRIYDLAKTVDLQQRYIYEDSDGDHVAKDPRRIAIEKMDGEKVILEFGNGEFYSLDELIPSMDDKPSILALAKKIAKDNGVSIVNEQQYLEEEWCDIEFNTLIVDLYRNIQGKVNVKASEFENFKKDLQNIFDKYHVPLSNLEVEIEEPEKLNLFEMDNDEVQSYLIHKNTDINQILEEKKGFIKGVKFGL